MAIHRFEVGTLKCIVLSELQNPVTYDESYAGSLPNASFDQMRAVLNEIGAGETGNHDMNALFVDDGNNKLLVDTGLGNPERSGLLASLAEADLSPEDITIVYLTHFHGDHIGGLTQPDGSLTFPNARYVTMKEEWEHWTNEATLATMGERAALIQQKILPLKDKMTLLAHSNAMMPGVQVVAAPGHTPGHSGLLLNSMGQRLLALADTIGRLPQFTRPDWHFIYDADKPQAVLTREAMLELAADENLLTFFYHMAFPGLGYVERAGKGFRWVPVASN